MLEARSGCKPGNKKNENAKPQGPNHSQLGSRSRQKREQGSIPVNVSEMGRTPVDGTLAGGAGLLQHDSDGSAG